MYTLLEGRVACGYLDIFTDSFIKYLGASYVPEGGLVPGSGKPVRGPECSRGAQDELVLEAWKRPEARATTLFLWWSDGNFCKR